MKSILKLIDKLQSTEPKPASQVDNILSDIKKNHPGIRIKVPKFRRTDGIKPMVLKNKTQLRDIVKTYSHDQLIKAGCRVWDDTKRGTILYLFPGEWYNSIPQGFPLVTVNGDKIKFDHGKTDDDIRYGVLAYGFLRKE